MRMRSLLTILANLRRLSLPWVEQQRLKIAEPDLIITDIFADYLDNTQLSQLTSAIQAFVANEQDSLAWLVTICSELLSTHSTLEKRLDQAVIALDDLLSLGNLLGSTALKQSRLHISRPEYFKYLQWLQVSEPDQTPLFLVGPLLPRQPGIVVPLPADHKLLQYIGISYLPDDVFPRLNITISSISDFDGLENERTGYQQTVDVDHDLTLRLREPVGRILTRPVALPISLGGPLSEFAIDAASNLSLLKTTLFDNTNRELASCLRAFDESTR